MNKVYTKEKKTVKVAEFKRVFKIHIDINTYTVWLRIYIINISYHKMHVMNISHVLKPFKLTCNICI